MIYTFPCSRQSTQHERKREIVSGHTGSGSLSFCSSLNYPAEGSSVQQTCSRRGTLVLVRADAKERQTSESCNKKSKEAATPQSLHAQRSRRNPSSDRSLSVISRVTLTSERSESLVPIRPWVSEHWPAVVSADTPDTDAANGLSVEQSLTQRVNQVHGVVLQDHQHVFALSRRTMSAQTATFGFICFQSDCPDTLLSLPIRYPYISRFRYQSKISTVWIIHTFIMYFIVWSVRKVASSDRC